MMIYPHPSLKELAITLAGELAQTQGRGEESLLRAIPVISPAKQFTDWIQVEMARTSGLCMGYEFIAIGEFLERTYAALGVANRGNPWEPRALTWRILPQIATYASQLGVEHPGSRDGLALSSLVADQFDTYAHYRPELIQSWQRNQTVAQIEKDRPTEAWQKELWLRLNELIGENHPGLLGLMQDPGKHADSLREAFPMLFVVGTGMLDPLLVDVLQILHKAGCEIQVHISLPSLEYLGDLRSKICNKTREVLTETDPEVFEMEPGHDLLVSMGRKAIGSFHLLGKLDENYQGWPEPTFHTEQPKAGTLLNQIQQDIRTLCPPCKEWTPAAGDLSVRVHSCFGPRREMEVLRDELLRAFKDLKGLQPDQVLVMTPSVSTYSPLVSAVLEQVTEALNAEGADAVQTPLSVRLTELPPAEQCPLAEGLMALLEMAHQGTYEASALLDLLQLRAVRACLGIGEDPKALETLRDWIAQSGFTRGLVARNNGEELGSLQFAADRLVAGDWFGLEPQAIYPGEPSYVLPVAEELAGHTGLRRKLLAWLAKLSEVFQSWQVAAPPKTWAERLTEALLELLLENGETEEEDTLDTVQNALNFLSDLECEEAIEAGALLDWLTGEFEQTAKRTSLTGQITFGEFKHLQHLPCRVLSMVGMQEGEFPRQNRTPAWSLLRLSPKIWDRNPRIDDRQLFLDALLSPQDRLIITANSRNVRSGKSEPFSVCVDELLRVAETMNVPRPQLVVEHRLQPFSPDYFQQGSESRLPVSFDPQSKKVAEFLLANADQVRAGIPFWNRATGIASGSGRGDDRIQVTVDELVAFWKDPAKGFLRAHGIQTYEDQSDDEDLDRLPLQLVALGPWKVKHAILQDGLSERLPPDYTKARLLAGRDLPPGNLGRDAWEGLFSRASSVLQQLQAKATGSPIPVQLDFLLEQPQTKAVISALLRTGTHQGQAVLLAYRLGEFKEAKYFLEPWIQAVVAAIAGHPLPTLLLDETTLKEPKLLSPIDAASAQTLLESLLLGWMEGSLRPLCYAPGTTDFYVKKTGGKKPISPELALNLTAAKWNGPELNSGPEGEGECSKVAWRDEDAFGSDHLPEWQSWAERIGAPLRAWTEDSHQ